MNERMNEQALKCKPLALLCLLSSMCTLLIHKIRHHRCIIGLIAKLAESAINNDQSSHTHYDHMTRCHDYNHAHPIHAACMHQYSTVRS